MYKLLVANSDNHRKSLSFLVSAEGMEVAPAYDPSTAGSYHTHAFASDRAEWPAVPPTIPLPGATTLAQVTRDSVLSAGETLGLSRQVGERALDRLARSKAGALSALAQRLIAPDMPWRVAA